MPTGLTDLPNEVLMRIVYYNRRKNFRILRSTCRLFYKITGAWLTMIVENIVASRTDRETYLKAIVERGYGARHVLIGNFREQNSLGTNLAQKYWTLVALGCLYIQRVVNVWAVLKQSSPDVSRSIKANADSDITEIIDTLHGYLARIRLDHPHIDNYSHLRIANLIAKYFRDRPSTSDEDSDNGDNHNTEHNVLVAGFRYRGACTEFGTNGLKQKYRSTLPPNESVEYKVGQVFRHRQSAYVGVIIGWLPRLESPSNDQPLYYVLRPGPFVGMLAWEDEEDIDIMVDSVTVHFDVSWVPLGEYFLRYDEEKKLFVSNVKDEYPED